MSAVEKFQNLIAEQAPKLAAIPRSCRQLDPAISGAACGTNDIGSSHARQPSIMEPVVLREGKGKIPEIKSDLTEFTASRDGAVRNAVGIRCGAFSGNMKVSFQAARSIG
jgi:hypothetical protein